MSPIIRKSLSMLLALLLVAANTWAQDGPSIVRLTVKPAPPPTPALKYTLLPPAIEQTPGNAAPIYLLAGHVILNGNLDHNLLQAWLRKPFADAVQDGSVPGLLNVSALDLLERASFHEYCHWETTIRQQGISTLLPHLNPLRSAAYMLGVHARAQIAEGRFDEAVRSIRTGITLAHHLDSDAAVLIQVLVSAGIIQSMAERLDELIQRDGAPNLYWALAQLPRPFLSLHRVTDFERFSMQFTFPELRQIDHLSDEQGRRVLDGIRQAVGAEVRAADPMKWTLLMASAYPTGKQYLLARGVPAQRVEAMSVHQVILRYLLEDYAEHHDEVAKWFAMPYPVAREGLKLAESKMDGRSHGNFLVSLLMPAYHSARLKLAGVDRRIALLMCVEGVRSYAAANQGKAPASLSDLSTTPAPEDPVTGKPFVYRVEGNGAVIEAPAPAGDPAEHGWKYEITLSR